MIFYNVRIRHNLSPKWTSVFILDHDEKQAWTPLKITIYDSRASASIKNPRVQRTDSTISPYDEEPVPILCNDSDPTMGEVNVEVGDILGREGQEAKFQLEHGGCVYVLITQSIDEQIAKSIDGPTLGKFQCHIRGLALENIESGLLGLGAIDPFFELSKKYTDTKHGVTRWICVYRSEHIPNIINPYWKPFILDLEKLCHGNTSKELKITVRDHQSGRRTDRWIGNCLVNVEWLQRSVTKGGNASREDALGIMNDEEEEVGLIVVLKADMLSA